MFAAGSADTGSLFSPGVGVDGARDVIRFKAAHKFLTGDAVRYNPGSTASVGVGLTTAGIYFVQKLDDNTLRLFATLADAQSAAQTFNAAAAVAGNQITVAGAGFADNTRVTYTEPTPVGFTRDLVEQKVNPSIDANTPSSQYFIGCLRPDHQQA